MNSARVALVTLAVRRYHVGRVAALEMVCRTPEYEAAEKVDAAMAGVEAFTMSIEKFVLAMSRINTAARSANRALACFKAQS